MFELVRVGEADLVDVMTSSAAAAARAEAISLAAIAELWRRRRCPIASVWEFDPRTLNQKRADSIGAMAAGSMVLSCRCDRPATHADIDHTIPYSIGATHPANTKCYCRAHHRFGEQRLCLGGSARVPGSVSAVDGIDALVVGCRSRHTARPSRTRGKTCIRIYSMRGNTEARRPQWRGERKAILIRVPLSVAEQLSAVAEASSESVSDTAGRLISAGLDAQEAGSK